MKKSFVFISGLILALMMALGAPETFAKKSSSTRKARKETRASAPVSRNITLYYQYPYRSDSYLALQLNSDGRAVETYYAIQYMGPDVPPEQWGAYKTYSTDYGTWVKNYRFVGNNNKQYYYEISVGGSTYYYIPGYDRLYIGFLAFANMNNSESYKLLSSPPADRRREYQY